MIKIDANYFVILNADCTWQGEFPDHQPHHISSDSHNSGNEYESDCAIPAGHNSTINVPDFLPAMQKALYVRLSQKQQDDGEQMSNQCQRSLSREEGIVIFCLLNKILLCF